MYTIFKAIIIHLIVIHNGTMVAKFKSTFFLSVFTALPLGISASFLDLTSEWIDENGGYVTFVTIAIAVDHLFGTLVHAFIKRDFSFKKNIIGVVLKLLLVFCVGVLFEGFQYIYPKENFITEYLTIITRMMVFLYPAGSAFMNCALLTNGKFPPIGWINKLTKFNETLDISKLKQGVNDEENRL